MIEGLLVPVTYNWVKLNNLMVMVALGRFPKIANSEIMEKSLELEMLLDVMWI